MLEKNANFENRSNVKAESNKGLNNKKSIKFWQSYDRLNIFEIDPFKLFQKYLVCHNFAKI